MLALGWEKAAVLLGVRFALVVFFGKLGGLRIQLD